MNYKPHIPNAITILNLLSGSLAVILIFKGYLQEAALLVFLATILDFLDGFVAKMLNAKSIIGKELDSLADVISFGLAPALFLFVLMEKHPLTETSMFMAIMPYTALLIAGFSALRLAKFNIDTRQSVTFLGLPTPANAILIISFTIVAGKIPLLSNNFYLQLAIIPISCYLLISEIPMFAIKFSKGFSFRLNKIRYIYLSIAMALVLFFGWFGVMLAVLIYILMSIILRER
jgi:CDP-diacylglycerol---serine O-phosphatidyltransferase